MFSYCESDTEHIYNAYVECTVVQRQSAVVHINISTTGLYGVKFAVYLSTLHN